MMFRKLRVECFEVEVWPPWSEAAQVQEVELQRVATGSGNVEVADNTRKCNFGGVVGG